MDSNIRDEYYEPVESINKTAIGAHVQTYFPTTANIAAGVISGQVVFELNTGAGEYLDLFKTHLQLRYTSVQAAAAQVSFGDCPLSNIIARGQLYINGKKVASSQNWTQDAVLSKRISFSRAYNGSVNNMTYNNQAAGLPFVDGPVASTAGTYTDDEYLDALFIRDESCIVPPNSNVRLLLDIDSNYAIKMLVLNVQAAPDNTMQVDSVRLIAYTVVKAGGHPKEHVMNLVTINSFLSTIAGTSENRQYQVSPTIVKAAVTFLSTLYLTNPAGAKLYAGNLLNYANDTDTRRLTALDFKLNNIVVPNTRWDFVTHGFRESYLNYVNESGGVSDSAGKESMAEWQRYGMIHLANIVKPESDKSNSLQVSCQFALQPAAFLIVTAFEENAVRFIYEPSSGALLDTQTLM